MITNALYLFALPHLPSSLSFFLLFVRVSTSRNLARRAKLASSCDDIIRNKDYRLACAALGEMAPRPVPPTAGITRLSRGRYH